MKLSVSLSDKEVAFLDSYAAAHRVDSRSAVIQRAVRRLWEQEIGPDYVAAWDEWEATDKALWDTTIADGLE